MKKVTDKRDNLTAERSQLEARLRQQTASHAVEMAKIGAVKPLRGKTERDAADIKTAESALLYMREIVHSRATKVMTFLNKMLRNLKSVNSDLSRCRQWRKLIASILNFSFCITRG